MPANWADTPEKEAAWKKAKEAVNKEYGSKSKLGDERYYSLVMGIAKKIVGEKKKKRWSRLFWKGFSRSFQ